MSLLKLLVGDEKPRYKALDEVPSEEVALLARLLYLPEHEMTQERQPSDRWLQKQKEHITKLPIAFHRRTGVQALTAQKLHLGAKESCQLCPAHKELNAKLVMNIFSRLLFSVSEDAGQIRNTESKLASHSEVIRHLDAILGIESLWTDRDVFKKAVSAWGPDFPEKYIFQCLQDRCEACCLSVVAGNRSLLIDLRASVWARWEVDDHSVKRREERRARREGRPPRDLNAQTPRTWTLIEEWVKLHRDRQAQWIYKESEGLSKVLRKVLMSNRSKLLSRSRKDSRETRAGRSSTMRSHASRHSATKQTRGSRRQGHDGAAAGRSESGHHEAVSDGSRSTLHPPREHENGEFLQEETRRDPTYARCDNVETVDMEGSNEWVEQSCIASVYGGQSRPVRPRNFIDEPAGRPSEPFKYDDDDDDDSPSPEEGSSPGEDTVFAGPPGNFSKSRRPRGHSGSQLQSHVQSSDARSSRDYFEDPLPPRAHRYSSSSSHVSSGSDALSRANLKKLNLETGDATRWVKGRQSDLMEFPVSDLSPDESVSQVMGSIHQDERLNARRNPGGSYHGEFDADNHSVRARSEYIAPSTPPPRRYLETQGQIRRSNSNKSSPPRLHHGDSHTTQLAPSRASGVERQSERASEAGSCSRSTVSARARHRDDQPQTNSHSGRQSTRPHSQEVTQDNDVERTPRPAHARPAHSLGNPDQPRKKSNESYNGTQF